MARNLYYLGKYYGNEEWLSRSAEMLKSVDAEMLGYGPGYSNWLILALHRTFPSREVVIVGKDVDKTAAEFRKHYLPNEIFAGSAVSSDVPVLRNRWQEGQNLIYVCENNTCQLPETEFGKALAQLKSG